MTTEAELIQEVTLPDTLIPTELVMLPLDQLQTDESYQRAMSDSFVARAVKNFNINLVRTPLVNLRSDNTYHVFDGQHTVEILKQKEFQTAFCRLYKGLSPIEEAKMWEAGFNQHAATAYDKYKVRLMINEDVAVGMQKIFNHFNVTPSSKREKGKLNMTAIVAAEKLYRIVKTAPPYNVPAGTVLAQVLALSTSVWENDSRIFENTLLDGWVVACRSNAHIVSNQHWLARAIEVFQYVTVESILNQARGKTKTARLSGKDVAGILIDLYNNGSNSRVERLAGRSGIRMTKLDTVVDD